MKYFDFLFAFNRFLTISDINSSEILLYLTLLNCANDAEYRMPFTVPVGILEARTRLSRATIFRARARLAERGLCQIDHMGRNKSAQYTIFMADAGAVSRSVSHSETLGETLNETYRLIESNNELTDEPPVDAGPARARARAVGTRTKDYRVATYIRSKWRSTWSCNIWICYLEQILQLVGDADEQGAYLLIDKAVDKAVLYNARDPAKYVLTCLREWRVAD